MKRLLVSKGGATTMEFALVVLQFLVLTFGTVEVGRYLWTVASMEQLAAEAARCLAVRRPPCGSAGTPSTTGARTFVLDRADTYLLNVTSSGVDLNASVSCQGSDVSARAIISGTFTSIMPMLGQLSSVSATACYPVQSTSS